MLTKCLCCAAASTDVLISMHGAGLTHVIFQPPGGALIELFPNYVPARPHFQKLSAWRHLVYREWSNKDARNEKENFATRIPPEVMLKLVGEVVMEMGRV